MGDDQEFQMVLVTQKRRRSGEPTPEEQEKHRSGDSSSEVEAHRHTHHHSAEHHGPEAETPHHHHRHYKDYGSVVLEGLNQEREHGEDNRNRESHEKDALVLSRQFQENKTGRQLRLLAILIAILLAAMVVVYVLMGSPLSSEGEAPEVDVVDINEL